MSQHRRARQGTIATVRAFTTVNEADLNRMNVLDLLEQACEFAVAHGLKSHSHIRNAADRVIDEIEDDEVRRLIMEE
jgi:hypothetical protein